MDAPSAFFFNLEHSEAQHKQMVCLRLPDGGVSTDVPDMRKHAVDFYSALCTAELCDSVTVLHSFFKDSHNWTDSRTELDSHLTLQDFTAAVGQLNTGRSPCIDGLPSDFYKHFWACTGANTGFNQLFYTCQYKRQDKVWWISAGLRSHLVAAGYTKLGHLVTSGSAVLSERIGIKVRSSAGSGYGKAKLAIWKMRKNQMLGQGAVDVVAVFLGLVAARLRLEHAYYSLMGKLPEFMSIWGINEILCTVDDVGNLRLMF
ncbi:hypothetical protein AOLI_G00272870 [Acnodon oligacanthus]